MFMQRAIHSDVIRVRRDIRVQSGNDPEGRRGTARNNAVTESQALGEKRQHLEHRDAWIGVVAIGPPGRVRAHRVRQRLGQREPLVHATSSHAGFSSTLPKFTTLAALDRSRVRVTSMRIESKEEHVTTTQDALQISTIVPSLTVDDLQKSLAFYEALGLTVR